MYFAAIIVLQHSGVLPAEVLCTMQKGMSALDAYEYPLEKGNVGVPLAFEGLEPHPQLFRDPVGRFAWSLFTHLFFIPDLKVVCRMCCRDPMDRLVESPMNFPSPRSARSQSRVLEISCFPACALIQDLLALAKAPAV